MSDMKTKRKDGVDGVDDLAGNDEVFRWAGRGQQQAVMSAVDKNKKLLSMRSEGNIQIGGVYVVSEATLLICACAGGHVNLATALIDKGSNVYAADSNNWNSLMYACWNDHISVVAMLMDREPDLEARDYGIGMTALHIAAYCDHKDICLLLLSCGADLLTTDDKNRTALFLYGKGLDGHPPTHSHPALSDAVKDERRGALRAAFTNA